MNKLLDLASLNVCGHGNLQDSKILNKSRENFTPLAGYIKSIIV